MLRCGCHNLWQSVDNKLFLFIIAQNSTIGYADCCAMPRKVVKKWTDLEWMVAKILYFIYGKVEVTQTRLIVSWFMKLLDCRFAFCPHHPPSTSTSLASSSDASATSFSTNETIDTIVRWKKSSAAPEYQLNCNWKLITVQLADSATSLCSPADDGQGSNCKESSVSDLWTRCQREGFHEAKW